MNSITPINFVKFVINLFINIFFIHDAYPFYRNNPLLQKLHFIIENRGKIVKWNKYEGSNLSFNIKKLALHPEDEFRMGTVGKATYSSVFRIPHSYLPLNSRLAWATMSNFFLCTSCTCPTRRTVS